MAWKKSMQNYRDPYTYLQLMFGLFLSATGVVFMLKADLGMGPWPVFHVGFTNHLPLTLGKVTQIVGLIIIISSLFLRIYPGIGTVLNMFFIGFFIDIVDPFILQTNYLVYQVTMLAFGILLFGMGTGLYINANLGAGPRDGLMLGLSKKTGKSIRMIRVMMEIIVLIVGFFLGGPVGVGTVAFALAIGPAVQFFLKSFPERRKSFKKG